MSGGGDFRDLASLHTCMQTRTGSVCMCVCVCLHVRLGGGGLYACMSSQSCRAACVYARTHTILVHI